MRPSYAAGFARYAADSKTPELWRGLVGAWCPFLGNTGPDLLRDVSGYHNHGTINGATWGMGRDGPALGFDGVNDHVDVGGPVTTAVDNVTMAMWVNWSGNDGSDQFLIANGDLSLNGYGFRVDVSDGNKIRGVCGGVGFITTTWGLTQGVWQFLVFERMSGQWKIYLDGTQQTITGNPTPNTPNTGTTIGGYHGGAIPFYGIISETLIYNRAITKREIQQLSNNHYALWELADIPYARVAVAVAHAGRLVNARRLKSKVGGGLV